MPFKLGKTAARLNSVLLKFRDYVVPSKLPTPPLIFGHILQVQKWSGVLGNDEYGDCCWAGSANCVTVWHAAGRKPPAIFSTESVLSDYSAQTGFNPKDPDTDTGTDMQEHAAYMKKTGVLDATGNRHTIDAYLALKKGDWEDLILATYLCNAIGVGVLYPQSADRDFDRQLPWTDTSRSRDLGGHYIPMFYRNSKGMGVCRTWDRFQGFTRQWYEKYNDETVAYISLDALDNNLISAEGFRRDDLKKDLASL